MPRAHPFFYINNSHYSSRHLLVLWSLLKKLSGLRMALKVAPEMLEQRYFLLQIFWVYSKRVLPAEILRVRLVAFHIVEMDEVGI